MKIVRSVYSFFLYARKLWTKGPYQPWNRRIRQNCKNEGRWGRSCNKGTKNALTFIGSLEDRHEKFNFYAKGEVVLLVFKGHDGIIEVGHGQVLRLGKSFDPCDTKDVPVGFNEETGSG